MNNEWYRTVGLVRVISVIVISLFESLTSVNCLTCSSPKAHWWLSDFVSDMSSLLLLRRKKKDWNKIFHRDVSQGSMKKV